MVSTNPNYNLTFLINDDFSNIFSPKCNVTLDNNPGIGRL